MHGWEGLCRTELQQLPLLLYSGRKCMQSHCSARAMASTTSGAVMQEDVNAARERVLRSAGSAAALNHSRCVCRWQSVKRASLGALCVHVSKCVPMHISTYALAQYSQHSHASCGYQKVHWHDQRRGCQALQMDAEFHQRSTSQKQQQYQQLLPLILLITIFCFCAF